MKSLYSASFIFTLFAGSSLAVSPDIYQSYRDDAFVEIIKRSTLPQTQSSSSSSSSSSSTSPREPSSPVEATLRKIRMTADNIQDDLRLLGWEEDFRAGNIARSGQLLFPEGMDVFEMKTLAAPWGTRCYALPFGEGGGDDDDGGEDVEGAVEGEDQEEEEVAREVNVEEVDEDEEDEDEDEDEDGVLLPYDRVADLEAEAAEMGIWRVPFSFSPEHIVVGGVVCVRRF